MSIGVIVIISCALLVLVAALPIFAPSRPSKSYCIIGATPLFISGLLGAWMLGSLFVPWEYGKPFELKILKLSSAQCIIIDGKDPKLINLTKKYAQVYPGETIKMKCPDIKRTYFGIVFDNVIPDPIPVEELKSERN